MTTLTSLVTSAFRENNLIAVGGSPTTAQSTEAITLLNELIQGLFGSDMGENLSYYMYGVNGVSSNSVMYDMTTVVDNSFIPPNSRLMMNVTSTKTINFPPDPQDGCRVGVIDQSGNIATYPITLNGNGNRIETATSVTLNTNLLAREWFYRADTGNWTRLATLAGSDSSPFGVEFDPFLYKGLNLLLAPRYGQSVAQETVATYNRLRSQFLSRYRQTRNVEAEMGLQKLPSNPYRGYIGNDTTRFQLGLII